MSTETFEKKVWRRLDSRWAWRVRVSGRAAFAAGSESTRVAADEAVKSAIALRELELRAPWKRVSA